MEIDNETILDLVKGQGQLTQAVLDIKERFDKSIPYLASQDKENAEAIRRVEKKIWYLGGAGTAAGFILEHLGAKYMGSIFGGK